MHALVQRARGSHFLRQNAIYLGGSIGVAFLNYLFYPVLGRLMVPSDFGEVQTIISFFLQSAVFLQVLGLVTVGIIRKYGDETRRDAIIAEISRLSLFFAVPALALVLFFSPWLKTFFQFGSIYPFVALAVALLISVPGAFANAYLQGHQRFAALSTTGLIAAGGKLIFATILVALGFKAFGAIAAIAIAQSIALVYAVGKSRGATHFVRTTFHLARPKLALVKPELRYALLVLTASLTINLLLSLDIIVIKHFFSPHEAGLYAGIATIARIIFFITGPPVAVLIASVKLSDPIHNRQLLLRALAICLALGGSALAVFTIAPNFAINLLLGSTYLAYADLLPRLSLAIFLLSTASLLVFYHVTLRQAWVAVLALAGLAATVGLIYFDHSTIASVVIGLLRGSAILLVLVGLASIWQSRVARG